MSNLFDELTVRSVTFPNRIGMSPMCMYSYEHGFVNDWQLAHLGARATGGVGLIIAEATAVNPLGRITPNDAGIWADEQIEPLAKTAGFIRSQGVVAGIQLAHAGRKACTHRPWEGGKPISSEESNWWQAVGASPVSFNSEYQVPHELTKREILDIEQDFVNGARRCLEAGFNLLEIHAGHGYLLHSFYSPASNMRNDEYGGNFHNRIRFLMEIIQKIRTVWPDKYPLMVRLSGTEWTENGWTVEDSISLTKEMMKAGVDIVDCSSGGNIPGVKVKLEQGYMVPISEQVRKATGAMTATVGLISDPTYANSIIAEGKADIVLLGRELLRNPTWPLQAAKALGVKPPIPPQYLRAYK